MKKNKRGVALVLAAALLVGCMSSFGGCGKPKEEYLTRAEWIVMLAERFGLDDYTTKEPVFSDVGQEEACYTALQSCADWEIVDKGESGEFYPDTEVQADFVIETALLAAGAELTDSEATDFAVQQGILENDGYAATKSRITLQRAQEILEWAVGLYLEQPFEEYTNVVLKEDMIDLSGEADEVTAVSDQVFLLSEAVGAEIARGDIILLPGDVMDPFGIAGKVESVEVREDGSCQVTVSEPQIGEVCEEMEIAAIAVPKAEDVILAEGVTWAGSGEEQQNQVEAGYLRRLSELDGKGTLRDAARVDGLDLAFEVNLTSGKMSITPQWDSMFGRGESVKVSGEFPYSSSSNYKPFEKESTIPDRNLFGPDPYDNTKDIEAYKRGDITLDDLCNRLRETQQRKKDAEMISKFTAGYEIKGSLKLKDFYLQLETKLDKVFGIPVGIKSFSVEVNSKVEASLSIKGKLKEELTIARVPIVICPGVTTHVKISLCTELNGEITVKATIENNTKTEYAKGKTKKAASQSSSLSGKASVQLDAGPQMTATLRVLGIDILDASVFLGIRFKGKTEVSLNTDYQETEEALTIIRKTHFENQVEGYVPIVKLKIGTEGKTLAKKLKLSFTWEIIGEKSAYHFNILPPIDEVIWSETLTLPKNPEESDPKETEEGDEPDGDAASADLSAYLTIDRYYLSMEPEGSGTIQITGIPEGYSESELVWSSDNPSVAAVSGGHVTAVGSGVAMITVRTADGMYEAFCTVSVGLVSESFEELKEL